MKHDPTRDMRDCAQVFLLRPRDTLRVDPVPISQMVDTLGEIGAEEAICNKLEDLTRHMRRIVDFHTACDFEGLATRARSVVDLADCIGLPLLAKVARDVVISVRNCDDMGVAATVARLARIADIALFEVGNLQDQGA
ncbi:hypothetical protein [Octadecabacter sp. R77987]|uniref:hypothetical protein n=1 Tax=Octadecabacter sp. R77987 TaxID=3093874 RepID=UPI00366E30B8